MGYLAVYRAGLAGTVALVIAGSFVAPVVAIAAGVAVTFLVTRREGAQQFFDSTGTVFVLSSGIVVWFLPLLRSGFTRTAGVSLLFVGLLSGLVVVTKRAIRAVATRTARAVAPEMEETASRTARFVNGVLGTLALAWSVIKLKERLARTAATGITGSTAFALRLVGVYGDLPWFLTTGVDLTVFVFVGSVAVGFHTLTSWYAMLALRHDPFLRSVGARSKDAATTVGEASKDAAASAGERSTDALDSATDATTTAVDAADETLPFGAGPMSRLLGIDEGAEVEGETTTE